MPIKEKNGKWYWGKQGPFDTKSKAQEVAQAAHASGYKGSLQKFLVFSKGEKYTKKEVQYAVANEQQVFNQEMCGTCHYFDAKKDVCSIVKGEIHDHMWCNKWESIDYITLNNIANISKTNIDKLQEAGIYTLKELANCDSDIEINLNKDTFERLRSQARLQQIKSESHNNALELLRFEKGRGLDRLPTPSKSDIFFDMEGYASNNNNLEYLFGVHYNEDLFKEFWGHNELDEQKSFLEVLQFFEKHINNNPDAHIYHYHHYETTALKKLANKYHFGKDILDSLINKGAVVDLYPVVKESLRISEPRYRLKNIEKFYMKARTDVVSSAISSIETYKTWTETQDNQLLKDIAQYNKSDCVSTKLLLKWLSDLKPIQKDTATVFTSSDAGVFTPTYGKYEKPKKKSKKDQFGFEVPNYAN